MKDAPRYIPTFDSFESSIAPESSYLGPFFDEEFRLCDFFNTDPDEALWVQDAETVQNTTDHHYELLQRPTLDDLAREANAITMGSSPQSRPQKRVSLVATEPQAETSSASRHIKSSSFTEPEWQKIFKEVLPLYLENSLKDIVQALPEKCGLKPSRKQLKTKIKLWHESGLLPRKNIDKDDMDYMVLVAHLRQEVQGLKTIFLYHGFPVLEEKLLKHKNRFGIHHRTLDPNEIPARITWTSFHAPDPALPPASTYTLELPGSQDVSPVKSAKRSANRPTVVPDPPTLFPEIAIDASAFREAQIGMVDSPEEAGLEASQPSLDPEWHHDDFGVVLEPTDKLEERDLVDGEDYASVLATCPSEGWPPHVNSTSHEHGLEERSSSLHTSEGVSPHDRIVAWLGPSIVDSTNKKRRKQYIDLQFVEDQCINDTRYLVEHLHQPDTAEKERIFPWDALISLHCRLLDKYHDFLFTSRYRPSPPPSKKFRDKNGILPRMWSTGCLSLLNLLQEHLPEFEDHLRSFICFAYQIYGSCYEMLPEYKSSLAESLGDLARFRMTVEDEGSDDRSIWNQVSRSWYEIASDYEPEQGRIYESLANSSQSNPLQQLFYCYRSLTACNLAKASQKSSMALLQGQTIDREKTLQKSFFNAHSALYRGDKPGASQACEEFLRLLKVNMTSRLKKNTPSGLALEEAIYIAVVNVSSLFGKDDRTELRFVFDTGNIIMRQSDQAKKRLSTLQLSSRPRLPVFFDTLTYRTSIEMLFSTFDFFLELRTLAALPHIYTVMAFLVSLQKALAAVGTPLLSSLVYPRLINEQVPWENLCAFLNSSELRQLHGDFSTPSPRATRESQQPLPEDYLLRGLVWTNHLFPSGWFDNAKVMEERMVDSAINSSIRVQRIMRYAKELCSYGYMHRVGRLFVESATSSFGPKPQCWKQHCNGRAYLTFSDLLQHERERHSRHYKIVENNCAQNVFGSPPEPGKKRHTLFGNSTSTPNVSDNLVPDSPFLQSQLPNDPTLGSDTASTDEASNTSQIPSIVSTNTSSPDTSPNNIKQADLSVRRKLFPRSRLRFLDKDQ